MASNMRPRTSTYFDYGIELGFPKVLELELKRRRPDEGGSVVRVVLA